MTSLSLLIICCFFLLVCILVELFLLSRKLKTVFSSIDEKLEKVSGVIEDLYIDINANQYQTDKKIDNLNAEHLSKK